LKAENAGETTNDSCETSKTYALIHLTNRFSLGRLLYVLLITFMHLLTFLRQEKSPATRRGTSGSTRLSFSAFVHLLLFCGVALHCAAFEFREKRQQIKSISAPAGDQGNYKYYIYDD
jgi:hypothetical protein